MGHKDDGFGSIFDGVLDGRGGTDNTLVIGDFLIGIERDIEVNLQLGVSLPCSQHRRP
jgi:hypothetical protein